MSLQFALQQIVREGWSERITESRSNERKNRCVVTGAPAAEQPSAPRKRGASWGAILRLNMVLFVWWHNNRKFLDDHASIYKNRCNHAGRKSCVIACRDEVKFLKFNGAFCAPYIFYLRRRVCIGVRRASTRDVNW
jgi:hypothetical protein